MTSDPVRLEVAEGIATLTLDRPENRNSMTPDVLARFREQVRTVADDASVRAVIVTGSGRSFCAGADFRSSSPADADASKAGLAAERSFAVYEPFLSVFDLEVPTLAAMNGHAIGGGLGLALVCDLRIANREARYGANFARLGFHSGMAVSYLLPRIVGVPTAADLLFSGRIVTGAEAEEIGLVNRAVAPEEVLSEARRKAEAIATAAPLAVRLLKRSLYAGAGWDPRTAAWHEAFAQSATLATEDAREGIRALLEKREPRFEGR
ncbi:MAG: enoyl-CoA hydratase/isomerase family protein [Myxococcota bacterium]